MKRKTQKEKVLALLKRKKFVMNNEFMRLGVACYTKCISSLRQDGYEIENIRKYNKKRGELDSIYTMSK